MVLGLPTAIALLVAATLLAMAAKRAEVPYNIALVVGGMVMTVSGVLPDLPRLDPEIVFYICLPALLFEAGITADFQRIKANAANIVLMSVAGTLLAIAVTGLGLTALLGLPLISAFILAALLGGTDTVSILYTFRRLPSPQRLRDLMEGETLFNDGAMLVAYAAVVGVLVGTAEPSILSMGTSVVISTLGGLVIGVALGLLGGVVVRQAQEPLAEIMATTAVAFTAYGVGAALNVSAAIAAVAAGIAVGISLRREGRAQSRVAITSFWEYVAFGVNTFLFLSIGLSTSLDSLLSHITEISLGVLCMFGGRAVSIYVPFFALRRLRPSLAVPTRWQHIFVLGNIKGALAVALALGLPATTPERALLVDVAFGVTFFSLVVQGLLLSSAMTRLGLSAEDPTLVRIGLEQGRLIAARAGRRELDVLREAGLMSKALYDLLMSDYQVAIAGAERGLRELHGRHIAQSATFLLTTRRRLIDAERAALETARRSGLLPEAAASELLADVDKRLVELERVLAGEAPLAAAPAGPGGPGEER